MDFRFFLIDKNDVQTEIEEPVGFDNFKPVINRTDNHGMGIEFAEQELGFYKNAYKLVTDEYAINGIEGYYVLLIEYLCGGEWQEFYKGNLDYGRYEEVKGDYCIVNIGIAQLGVEMTFKNRREVKIDLDSPMSLDGVALPEYNNLGRMITVPSKSIKLINKASVDGLGNKIDIAGNKKYKMPFGSMALTQISDFSSEELFKIIGEKYEDAIFVNNMKNIVNPIFKISSNYSFILHGPNGQVDILVEYDVFDKNNNFIKNIHSTLHRINIVNTYGATNEVSFEKEVDIPFESKLAVTITGKAAGSVHECTVMAYSEIVIQLEGKSKPTSVKNYMLHESLSRIVEAATDGQLTVKSDYYGRTDSDVNPTQIDGNGSLRSTTNGLLLRNTILTDKNRPVMSISWKDLIEGLNAIDAIGYGIEGNTLRIELWKYFYNDEVIMRCVDIDKVKRSLDLSRCYQLLNIGYEKWESEENNGIDGFHGKRQYRTRLKNSQEKFEKFSKLVADGYAIEATRRRGMDEKATSDWRYDKEIFIFDLVRSESKIAVNTGSGDSTTLIDPDTIFNVALSPARIAARWMSWILQGVNNAENSELVFASAEGYTGAKTTSNKGYPVQGEILESQNFSVNQVEDGLPILKPETVEFEYPFTIADYHAVKTNPHGLIEFDGEHGWIKEIEYDITVGKAKFKLIPRA